MTLENLLEFPKRRKEFLPRSAPHRQHGPDAHGRTADRWIAGLQPPEKSRQIRNVFIEQQSAYSQEHEALQNGKKKADESQDEQQGSQADTKITIHLNTFETFVVKKTGSVLLLTRRLFVNIGCGCEVLACMGQVVHGRNRPIDSRTDGTVPNLRPSTSSGP